ncbi:ribonuclease H1-like [Bactrocera neohumeralis]|uniref:ribonuclease H1-like n=1 Tax=Bactrocera neohumeralis TaxID=98809 RepID=UPI0021664A68|nr:ribonuclease H1-like [Bactrocera neohumeralis]
MPFYAVAKGRKEGIYTTWAECEQQVKKFSGAIFKKFPSLSEATDFLIKHEANNLRSELENKTCGKGFQQLCVLQNTLANTVKQENPVSSESPITQNIKEEPLSGSLLFNDNDGDKELLTVLRQLEEGQDVNTRIRKADTKVMKLGLTANTKPLKIGHYTFDASDDGYINVYIGGHSENIGNWNCMAGYGIYFGEGHPLNVSEAATGRMTRNVGDIEAAIEAIEIAVRVGIPKLCLHTKSEFLLNAVAFWMNIWKRHEWRNKAGKVVQNRKQFEKLYALINESNIHINWADGRNDSGISNWKQVEKLAEFGTEDYLDRHPSKEDSASMEYFDDFAY